tara:strand:+ start:171 stop:524 length:354 start_codon:yes stop_codon:yes gene_type:complete
MNRPSPLIWIFLFLILILPTATGRILLDLAGGLLLIFFTISLIIAGVGWLGWRKINANMKTCEDCGSKTISNSDRCLICGSNMNASTNINEQYTPNNFKSEASQTTVDIIAKDADRN